MRELAIWLRPAVTIGRARRVIPGLAGTLAVVAVWELLRAVSVLPADLAPSFAAIVPALLRLVGSGALVVALWQSLVAWTAGMGLTLAVGLPVGALLALSRWGDAFTSLIIDFLRPVPAVAYVPVAVVLFGLEVRMQMFLIAIAAVWPVIFNTRFGIRNVDPLFLDTARVVGLSKVETFVQVVLPAALPAIFTGVRTAASTAVVLTVVSEVVASGTGVGGFVAKAQENHRPVEAFAGLLMAGAFGYLVYLLMHWVETRLTWWHSARGEGA